jgi:hypothetical protein
MVEKMMVIEGWGRFFFRVLRRRYTPRFAIWYKDPTAPTQGRFLIVSN